MVFIIAIGLGSARFTPVEAYHALFAQVFPGLFQGLGLPDAADIVIGYRLPRILLAILTGVSLAVAGTVMQALLRNPLVSPFTLGLSSAASFGAGIGIVLGPLLFGAALSGLQDTLTISCAFLFGILSMVLITGISRSRTTTQATLVLAGVVIGYIFQAGVLLLKYVSNNDSLRDLVLWLMGGVWGAGWGTILILTPLVTACVLILESQAWNLNAFAAGDEIAKNLGINVERFRMGGLMVATAAAAGCLAFTGIIGFIGLMAPHICRMVIGNDVRYLIPGAALLGAVILLISDTIARTVMSPVEIPVGVIMYIAGGAFFLYLIFRGKGRHIY